jgi:hypothetical protein
MSETYDVYFGESPGSLELLASGLVTTQLAVVGPFEYDTTYYWRVDATNENGTTTGDVWSFTTLEFKPPQASYTLISGGSGLGPSEGGVEGVDWNWSGTNMMTTVKRLVAAAKNRIWYEEV